MSIEDDIRGASNQRDALILIGHHLDRIEAMILEKAIERTAPDPWAGGWDVPTTDVLDNPDLQRRAAEIDAQEGSTEVKVRPATEYQMVVRAAWATKCALWEHIPLDRAETLEAYAKGGPMWLYLGNRDAVMAMPVQWRQELVQQLLDEGAHADAHEVGRDILKSEDSVPLDNALDAIERGRAQ